MDASNGWWTDHFVVHPASTSSAHFYYHNNNSNNPQGKTARGQGKQATPLQPTWKAGLSAASSYSTHPRPHRSGGERSRIRRGEEQRSSGKESGVCRTAGALTNHDFVCTFLIKTVSHSHSLSLKCSGPLRVGGCSTFGVKLHQATAYSAHTFPPHLILCCQSRRCACLASRLPRVTCPTSCQQGVIHASIPRSSKHHCTST